MRIRYLSHHCAARVFTASIHKVWMWMKAQTKKSILAGYISIYQNLVCWPILFSLSPYLLTFWVTSIYIFQMSTPHPIKSRLQRTPKRLQKQAPLVRSSSMPESLDKVHKRRKLHHLLGKLSLTLFVLMDSSIYREY